MRPVMISKRLGESWKTLRTALNALIAANWKLAWRKTMRQSVLMRTLSSKKTTQTQVIRRLSQKTLRIRPKIASLRQI